MKSIQHNVATDSHTNDMINGDKNATDLGRCRTWNQQQHETIPAQWEREFTCSIKPFIHYVHGSLVSALHYSYFCTQHSTLRRYRLSPANFYQLRTECQKGTSGLYKSYQPAVATVTADLSKHQQTIFVSLDKQQATGSAVAEGPRDAQSQRKSW